MALAVPREPLDSRLENAGIPLLPHELDELERRLQLDNDANATMTRLWACQAIRQLRAVPREPDPPEWQPIETAPTDGTVILVGTHDWFAASKHYSEGRWWTWHPPLFGERPSLNFRAEPPTHWMLLPNPPNALAVRPVPLRQTGSDPCSTCHQPTTYVVMSNPATSLCGECGQLIQPSKP